MKNTLLIKFSKILLIIGYIPAFLLFTSQKASAQEATLSLGYAPTALYLKLQPGEVYSGETVFWNLATRTIQFDVVVKGFEQVENFPGTSRILSDAEDANDPYSASKWISIEQQKVEIGPNSSEIIEFTIVVPEDAATGEHHASVFLLSSQQDRGNAPGSKALADLGSGPAILIHVGDELKEDAELEAFTTDKTFYETPPVTFLTRYRNEGNTHITPAGDIILKNFLGQEIKRIEFNENRQSVLRDNFGTYEDIWENDSIFLSNGKLAIGPIEAKLITTYRSVNPGFAPLSATVTFWVLPWKYILIAIAVLGFLYTQTIGKRNSRRKPKRRFKSDDIVEMP